MIPQEQFAKHAQSFVGVPFHHQGRNGVGVDCIGLVMLAANRCKLHVHGKPLKDYDRTDYGREPSPPYLDEMLEHCFEPVSMERLQVGDILLFRILKQPQHVGVYLGGNQFVHAYEPHGKVKIDFLEKRWKHQCCGAYRIPTDCFGVRS